MQLSASLLGLVLATVVAASNSQSSSHGGSDGIANRLLQWWKPNHHVKMWMNWHKSIPVGGNYEVLFEPSNGVPSQAGKRFQTENFLKGLKALQDVVARGVADKKRVRAYGSKWASSNIAYVNEYPVATSGLNYIKVGMDEAFLTAAYKSKPERLTFVQCGVMVQGVHQALFEKGQALSTTGAADGQLIAGAISTGTHGSNNQFGSMTEFVRGIHMVTNKEHVFIQRASDPVVTNDYMSEIGGARLIEDDAMFNSALVSFGSFGIIHALVIETEPLYKLKMQSKEMGPSKVLAMLDNLNVAQLGFEGVDELPMHFEVTFNPYKLDSSTEGAFVRVFQKVPLEGKERWDPSSFRLNPEPTDLFGATVNHWTGYYAYIIGRKIQKWIYGIGIQIPLYDFFDTKSRRAKIKYPFEFFTSDDSTDDVTSAPLEAVGTEMAFPQKKLTAALRLMFNFFKDHPQPSPVACRFVKPSKATLAFQRYDDLTAIVELPSAWGYSLFQGTGKNLIKLFSKLEENRDSIPHTFHWGQFFPENSYWVRNAYGSALDEFKAQRALLLDEEGRHMFSTDLLTKLGIHDGKIQGDTLGNGCEPTCSNWNPFESLMK